MKRIIDVHCHLFNGGYALAELAWAGWNRGRGNYPYRGARSLETTGTPLAVTRQEGTRAFAAYVGRLLSVVVSDSRGNYRTLKRSLEESAMAGRELIIVPLMMEIYYALDDNSMTDLKKPGAMEGFFPLRTSGSNTGRRRLLRRILSRSEPWSFVRWSGRKSRNTPRQAGAIL